MDGSGVSIVDLIDIDMGRGHCRVTWNQFSDLYIEIITIEIASNRSDRFTETSKISVVFDHRITYAMVVHVDGHLSFFLDKMTLSLLAHKHSEQGQRGVRWNTWKIPVRRRLVGNPLLPFEFFSIE